MTTLTLDTVLPSLTTSLRRLAPTADPELQELLGNLVEAVHLLAAQGKPPPTMTPAKPSATSDAAPAVTPHGPANGVGAPPPTEDMTGTCVDLRPRPSQRSRCTLAPRAPGRPRLTRPFACVAQEAAELVASLDEVGTPSSEEEQLALLQHQQGVAANQAEEFGTAVGC